jgi:hypothetical protein
MSADETQATIALHNLGDAIAPALIERIFEYGVSGAHEGAEPEGDVAVRDTAGAPQRGQGLFVAKTYMAKMGGTIVARNGDDGVWFVLMLPRA